MTDEQRDLIVSVLNLIQKGGIAADEGNLSGYFQDDGSVCVEMFGPIGASLATLREVCLLLGRDEDLCAVINFDTENQEHTRLFFAANKNSTPVD